MTELTTLRLVLRPATVDDAAFFVELNKDPEIRRFTGDQEFSDVADAADFLDNRDPYQILGFGRWMILHRATRQPAGWCGIKNQLDDMGIVDLGCRLHKDFRRSGYATEASLALLEWGFSAKNLDVITARVMPENTPSIAALHRIGMEYLKHDTCGPHPADWYQLSRAKWANKGG